MTKSTTLPDLIDAWVEEYSAEEFIEQFMGEWTFGDMVDFMYQVGEIPTDVIEDFLNDE